MFKKNNHGVHVGCARQRKYGLNTEFSIEHGINMLRVRIGNINQTQALEKGLSTAMVEQQYFNASKKYYKGLKFHLIFYTTPPITFDKVIKYIKKEMGANSFYFLKVYFLKMF